MRGITKWFPGLIALSSVNFDLRAAEVYVLLGENGGSVYEESLFVRRSLMESDSVCQWLTQPLMLWLFIFRQHGSMVGR